MIDVNKVAIRYFKNKKYIDAKLRTIDIQLNKLIKEKEELRTAKMYGQNTSLVMYHTAIIINKIREGETRYNSADIKNKRYANFQKLKKNYWLVTLHEYNDSRSDYSKDRTFKSLKAAQKYAAQWIAGKI